ncbi:hypothetical protein DPMN_062809 [Dreissena polymorpha]|uniref:Nuclease HARBI1 n=1 Tax=Dreissena polymorpha TaxID=45954 RepID=A0A9D4CAI5_DREPO|nr:hypothetical protein DPMN_062809 [Dreissena polymorpha]
MEPAKVSKIIVACVVLHNLAKAWREREAFPEEEDPQPPPIVQLDGNHDGQAFRDAITANYFRFENNLFNAKNTLTKYYAYLQ